MDASVISALAGLLGAGIGGLTSVLASWLNQHTQARAQWLAQDRARLQELYKDFIEEASRSHIELAPERKPGLACAHRAQQNAYHVLAEVVESADQIVRAIVDIYLAANKTFPELRDMFNRESIDLLQARPVVAGPTATLAGLVRPGTVRGPCQFQSFGERVPPAQSIFARSARFQRCGPRPRSRPQPHSDGIGKPSGWRP